MSFSAKANNFQTYLASTHTSGSGSIVVTSTTGLPTTYPYRITVYSAILGQKFSTIFNVSEAVGTTLTVTVAGDEYPTSADQNFTVVTGIDFIVEMDITAGTLMEYETAINAAQTAINAVLGSVYPVGSLYFNASNATNPATLLGFGTWVAFGAGQVPVGYKSGDANFGTLGQTGGEVAHTLSLSEVPGDTVTVYATTGTNTGGGAGAFAAATGASNDRPVTGSTHGGGGAHNNLQPYVVVYIWKRTA